MPEPLPGPRFQFVDRLRRGGAVKVAPEKLPSYDPEYLHIDDVRSGLIGIGPHATTYGLSRRLPGKDLEQARRVQDKHRRSPFRPRAPMLVQRRQDLGPPD